MSQKILAPQLCTKRGQVIKSSNGIMGNKKWKRVNFYVESISKKNKKYVLFEEIRLKNIIKKDTPGLLIQLCKN
jgi:predicted phosphohydrolase